MYGENFKEIQEKILEIWQVKPRTFLEIWEQMWVNLEKIYW